jgi:hypothetical protein
MKIIPKPTRIQYLNLHTNKYDYFNFFTEMKQRRMRSVEDWETYETKSIYETQVGNPFGKRHE